MKLRRYLYVLVFKHDINMLNGAIGLGLTNNMRQNAQKQFSFQSPYGFEKVLFSTFVINNIRHQAYKTTDAADSHSTIF